MKTLSLCSKYYLKEQKLKVGSFFLMTFCQQITLSILPSKTSLYNPSSSDESIPPFVISPSFSISHQDLARPLQKYQCAIWTLWVHPSFQQLPPSLSIRTNWCLRMASCPLEESAPNSWHCWALSDTTESLHLLPKLSLGPSGRVNTLTLSKNTQAANVNFIWTLLYSLLNMHLFIFLRKGTCLKFSLRTMPYPCSPTSCNQDTAWQLIPHWLAFKKDIILTVLFLNILRYHR